MTPLGDLERLAATEAVRDLQARYVRLADAREWRALAGLFLPGGVFVALGMDGAPLATMIGRAAIEATISAGVGTGRSLHRLFSHEIEVLSPNAARGIFAMEDWVDRSEDPTPGPFRTLRGRGHYHTDYERVGGAWFIARQTLRRTMLELT